MQNTYTPFMQTFEERERARQNYYRLRNWAVFATVWAVCVTITLAVLVATWGAH